MKTIRLATDLHCGNCVAKLKPVLDGDRRVHQWSVDLQQPGHPVTVSGELSAKDIEHHLNSVGYHVVREAGGATTGNGFWSERPLWSRAAFNTLSCLLGCSIGDFGMIIYLQAFHPGTSMAVQMVLAILAGLATSVALETVLMRKRERLTWGLALRMALSMSFVSMVSMEVAMNLTDFMITGGRLALADPRYWLAFVPSALAGFLVPLPYNYYQLKKHGKACH
ncbi:MAG: DUF4396 domain-containing protein [Flavobacteriales bacterium]|nr:DUF4396 domain-containing protein [Flavobacteriales bacterium]